MTNAPRKHTGRARNETSREAVLTAALIIARDRPESFSIDRVVEVAGVGKQTVYRWWPSLWALLLDALLASAVFVPTEKAPGPIPTPADFLTETFQAIAGPDGVGPVLRLLMARAQHDPDFATLWRERFIQARRDALIQVLDAAGVADPALATDMIFGAMWYRLLVGHGPLDEAFARSLSVAVTPADPDRGRHGHLSAR